MKRWGWLVAGLYAVALVVLSLPVAMAAFWPKIALRDVGEMYRSWPYWAWIALMVCAALLMLFVPVRVVERRLKGRRPLAVPIVTAGFLLALLSMCGLISVAVGIWGDHGVPLYADTGAAAGIVSAGLIAVSLWLGWGALFCRASRQNTPEALTRRATRWLLRGSILEFLVAVCCHVAVRRRDDCCAPIGSFVGIAAGVSVMLLAFGPGVFFLFAERCGRLKPSPSFSPQR